jgi:ribonuclease P protein component
VRDTIRRGRRVRAGGVVVHHLPDSDQPRAAVVAGKALGGSVARHRRQRQLRHALAGMWPELPGGSWVIRALPGDGDPVRDLRRAVQRV